MVARMEGGRVGGRERQGESWRVRGEGEESIHVQPAMLPLTMHDFLAPIKRSVRARGNLLCKAVQGGGGKKKQIKF